MLTRKHLEEQKYITPKVGVAHLLASNDEEAMKITRKLLSYLPQNNIDPVEIFLTMRLIDYQKILIQ